MSIKPSKPFSNGTEYEIFLDNFCNRCQRNVNREDGFPEFPEKGGCPVRDAMENARFDISKFPSDEIVELRNAKDDKLIAWNYCRLFYIDDDEIMNAHFTLISRALFADWGEKKDG